MWLVVANSSERGLVFLFHLQVFMPDKANGFDVQSEADAMIERQQREILPGKSKTK